jgi:hypothetical protein
MDMEKVAISVVGGGNSAFLRAFTIPLAEDLEKIEGFGNKTIPAKGVMEVDSRPKACDLPTIGFFGVLLFIPGWFAKKVLEELYEIKIRPAVRRIIKEADKTNFSHLQKSLRYLLFKCSMSNRMYCWYSLQKSRHFANWHRQHPSYRLLFQVLFNESSNMEAKTKFNGNRGRTTN